MKHVKLFENWLNEGNTPQEEAQNILDDILQEREPDELQGMTMEDAMETVKGYNHTGKEAEEIAKILHSLAEGL
jgi:hypothetical protein